MSNNKPPMNFYSSSILPTTIYHDNQVPYQSFPNGQYVHSQLDSKYIAQNTSLGKRLDTPTTKPRLDRERLEKIQNQDHSNTNSESSTDSDDSNNGSDSSTSDSDVEKGDKENSSKQAIKPFRINLTTSKVSKLLNLKYHKTTTQ